MSTEADETGEQQAADLKDPAEKQAEKDDVVGERQHELPPIHLPAAAINHEHPPINAAPTVVIVQQPLFDKDSPDWLCCCGHMHVERGARIIAYIAIGVKLIAVIANAISQQWFPVVVAGVGCLMYSLILLAQWRKNPRFYLPFLVANGIYLSAVAVAIVLLVIGAIAVYRIQQNVQYSMQLTPNGFVPVAIQSNPTASSLQLWLDALLMLVDFLLAFKHQLAVHKAYKYMKAAHTVAKGQVQPE